MSDDTFQKVIDTAKITDKAGGFLSESQEKFVIGNLNIEPRTVQVYRQFAPMKDSWEYTLYYKTEGIKKRVYFEIESKDMDITEDLERFVGIVAKAVVRSHYYRDKWFDV